MHNNPVNNTDPSGLFAGGISGVMAATSIRSILANIQADFGMAAQFAGEAVYTGMSLTKAVLFWVGGIVAGIAIGLLLKALSKFVSRFISPIVEEMLEKAFEVLNGWRTLDLPIMPPVPGSFHAFPHRPQG